MEKTGVRFDANSPTFTLKNLIDMNLWKYTDSIDEIVALRLSLFIYPISLSFSLSLSHTHTRTRIQECHS